MLSSRRPRPLEGESCPGGFIRVRRIDPSPDAVPTWSQRVMSSVRLVRPLALAGLVLAVGGCANVDWVTIEGASATDPSATSLYVGFDFCATTPPQVTETLTEVHLLINVKVDKNGAQKACIGGAAVHLSQSIGDRAVIDDRHHRFVKVTFSPPVVSTPTPRLSGSVSELRGKDGNATITAWLLIDAAGAAVMCDGLPGDATTCPGPSIAVDWEAGGTKPPTGLALRDGVQVSDGPITLRGSLKVDILYVGVTP